MGFREKNNFVATESGIQERLMLEYMSNPQYALAGLYVFGWESDFLLKTKAGYWYEVEIKISKADFLNDFKNKKEKHEALAGRAGLTPNYFSYCVPQELVAEVKDLLPDYAGLCQVDGHGHVKWSISPLQLHSRKISDEELRLCEKFYYNYRNLRWKHNHKDDTIQDLRREIAFLKAEFEAETGHPISDNF